MINDRFVAVGVVDSVFLGLKCNSLRYLQPKGGWIVVRCLVFSQEEYDEELDAG